MNFYKRYIGDIQRDTGHLSLAEMGAYDRLLDHYYATEQRLPADVDACHRIARAMTKEERKAVESVLVQFFILDGDVYSQGRADKEITEALPAMNAARTNGVRGGRPKNNKTETQKKPSGFLEETQGEPSSKPHHSQTPDKNKGKNNSAFALLAARGISDQIATDWITLRKAKRAAITETALNGIQREADKARISLQSALEICCARGWAGFKAEWIDQQTLAKIHQSPRMATLAQIFPERVEHGTDRQIIDIIPPGSIQGDGEGVPAHGLILRQSGAG